MSAPREPRTPPQREPEADQHRKITATPCQRRRQNASHLQIMHHRRLNVADPVAHPLLPNDSPGAFTTVRTPLALCISLTPVQASFARVTPASFRISSPTQPSLRFSSQTALPLHSPTKQLRILTLPVSTKQWQMWIASNIDRVCTQSDQVVEREPYLEGSDVPETKIKILLGIWVFRRKHTTKGIISKHKGRFCVHGDLYEGEVDT
jgi:hypothetical protein